ncbi:MAG: hypothetical protein GTN93_04110 [Anaerolineae bacterium]|nr:hypothetical protein [Anaerolineae bacterium]
MSEKRYCICGNSFRDEKRAYKKGWRYVKTDAPMCPLCYRARSDYYKGQRAPDGRSTVERARRQ